VIGVVGVAIVVVLFVFKTSASMVIPKGFRYIQSIHVDLSAAMGAVAVASVPHTLHFIVKPVSMAIVLTVGDVGEETVVPPIF
jgi:hypothetical protein